SGRCLRSEESSPSGRVRSMQTIPCPDDSSDPGSLLTCQLRAPAALDQGFEGRRADGHCLLRKTMKQPALATGSSGVEPKRELVEIVVELFMCDRAAIGVEQPSIQTRRDVMDMRQQLRRLRLARDARRPVEVAMTRQRLVSQLCGSVNETAWGNR